MWLKTRKYEVRRKTTGKVLFSSTKHEEAVEWMKNHRSVELVVLLLIERAAA